MRTKPGVFDLFIVTMAVTIPMVFGLNCIQPLPPIRGVGILFLVTGVVIMTNELIPWGCVPK